MSRWALFAVVLVGCSDKGDDSSGNGTLEDDSGQVVKDADSDGFPVPDDCDDDDPEIHPEADETCDEVDNDCDGTVDDDPVDAIEYFADADADGYGAGKGVLSCEAVTGSVANDDDCDDTNKAIRPNATEVCDDEDVDEDCDSLVDDEDDSVDASSGITLYADGDGDEYGDSAASVVVCENVAGYVATTDDCDDTNAAVNPAAKEVCGDGLDNDCDKVEEQCGLSGDVHEVDAAAMLTGSKVTYGQFGYNASGIDSNGDGIGDLAVSARRNYMALFTGPITSTSVDKGAEAVILGEGPDDEFGADVQEIDDQNGDGYDDLLSAAQWYPGGTAQGRMYVMLGPISGIDTVDTIASATITGSTSGDQIGFSPTSGDVNGDGVADFLFGAPFANLYNGAAFLFYGPVTSGDLVAQSDADVYWGGDAVGDGVGLELSANGDLDGDGIDDVAIGSPGTDTSFENGAVWIFYGPVTGGFSISEADVGVTGADEYSYMGPNAIGGDFDADGFDDLAVAGPHLDKKSPGNVWVFNGASVPEEGTLDVASADARIEGDTTDQFGTVLDSAGDLNTDGNDDLVVGSYTSDGYNGSVWGYFGPVSGALTATPDSSFVVHGELSDAMGSSVDIVPDVTGDGIDDLAAGAFFWDPVNSFGAMFVFGGTGP
jgi:hypothetical protein